MPACDRPFESYDLQYLNSWYSSFTFRIDLLSSGLAMALAASSLLSEIGGKLIFVTALFGSHLF